MDRKTFSNLNIILREQEQVLLFDECKARLSSARGGIKISSLYAALEMARLYLEHADEIDPVSPQIRAIMDKVRNP